jgi:probable phosphoglycerate mutase
MTTIILVRHGTTEWNHQRRYQGQLDIPLSEQGQQEALQIARYLQKEGSIAAIYSSTLSRAMTTARLIAEQLEPGGLTVQGVPGLVELDVGHWTGLTPQEVAERYPEEYARFNQDKNLPRGGGESRQQLEQRVVAALAPLVKAHPEERIVAVTHGAVIKTLAGWALQLPIQFQPNFHGVTNASLTYLEVTLEPERRTRLAAYNLPTTGSSPLSVEMSEG